MTVTVATVLLLACIARLASAQDTPLAPLWQPAWGLHFGGIQRASLALGTIGVMRQGQGDDALLLLVEPGMGGMKARAGYARSTALIGGLSVNASVLRTFSRPRAGGDPWRTYAGGEVRLMWILINVGAGLYAPISGSERYPDRGGPVATVTFGLGL